MTPSRQNGEQRVVDAALQALESLARAGVRQLGKPAPTEESAPEPPPAPAASSAPSTAAAAGPPAEAAASAPLPVSLLPTPPAPASLEQVRAEVAVCTACAELCATRTQTVFGVGNPRAQLCFLGEAPGADEDAQGEPFVGRAGQLLTRIIEACTLERSDVYILNVLKCRPPGNRNPLPDEVANCRGFLNRQLALIRPEYLCCLGAVAAQTLLDTQQPIGRMRGKFFDYQGIAVMCTYHPAYLLRNPAAKKDVWQDMQMLMAKMGISLRAESKRPDGG